MTTPPVSNLPEPQSGARDGLHVLRPMCGKARRKRTVFSRECLDVLLKTFKENPYPGFTLRDRLSEITGIPEARLQGYLLQRVSQGNLICFMPIRLEMIAQVWFQNRRARTNKAQARGKENSAERSWPRSNPRAPQGNSWQAGHCSRTGHEEAATTTPLSNSSMNNVPQSPKFTSPHQATSTMPSKFLQKLEALEEESSAQGIQLEFEPCWTELGNGLPEDLLNYF